MIPLPESSVDPAQCDRDRQDVISLLLALLPIQILYPVLASGPSGTVAMVLFLSLLAVCGVWVMRGSRRRFLLTAILSLVSLELLWVSLWPAATSLQPLGQSCILFLLVILSGRYLLIFVRSRLPLLELLPAAGVLYLLFGTMAGLGIYLVRGLYQAASTCGPGWSDLAGSLFSGVSLITLNSAGLLPCDTALPLIRIIHMLGMIAGVLLFALVIGKTGVCLLKKEI
jgi:hypothetical protein